MQTFRPQSRVSPLIIIWFLYSAMPGDLAIYASTALSLQRPALECLYLDIRWKVTICSNFLTVSVQTPSKQTTPSDGRFTSGTNVTSLYSCVKRSTVSQLTWAQLVSSGPGVSPLLESDVLTEFFFCSRLAPWLAATRSPRWRSASAEAILLRHAHHKNGRETS